MTIAAPNPRHRLPYPGLRPLGEADRELFFGRETQVLGLLRQLRSQAFVAVVGSSGSGKSSLVRAGLLPAVREGFLLGTTDWRIVVLKPGHRPYVRLLRELQNEGILKLPQPDGKSPSDDAPATPEEQPALAKLLKTDRGLLNLLDESTLSPDTRVLVVVDQFEELFAFRRVGARRDNVASRDEAAAFVRMLLRSCGDADSRVRVVLTMRSEFIGDCEAFLGLPEAISRSQFLVPRLDRSQMAEAIARPGRDPIDGAAFAPFTFEEGLVNRIINDAGDRPDQLPLMQHALMRTWKLSDGARLTHADYERSGGIEKALSLHADAAWDEIKPHPRKAVIAMCLFRLLCDIAPDGQITRRRSRVADVLAVTNATLAKLKQKSVTNATLAELEQMGVLSLTLAEFEQMDVTGATLPELEQMDVTDVRPPELEEIVRLFQNDDRNFILAPADRPLADGTFLDISHEALLRRWNLFAKKWYEQERRQRAQEDQEQARRQTQNNQTQEPRQRSQDNRAFPVPSRPIGRIALALSGGGYRAAAFHLGTLHTLYEAGLLPDVAILSAVSGGTLVGAAYALSLVQQQPFLEFFDDFRERLRTCRPFRRAAEILAQSRAGDLPRHTLIVAQAKALSEGFFGDRRFGELLDVHVPIEELALNATDFRAGLSFRFLKSLNRRARIGNGLHSMPRSVAEQLRIADVVAASSCFPGGFEPIGFPHDFRWDDPAAVAAELPPETFREPLPLMDGGVADAQCLGSLRDSLLRWRKQTGSDVGLIFISDASPAGDQPLLRHTVRPAPAGPSLGNALWGGRMLFCLAFVALVLLGARIGQMVQTRDLVSFRFAVESVLAFVLSATVFVGLLWTWGRVRRLFRDLRLADPGMDVWGSVSRMSVASLQSLARMRFESLFAMSSDVFMKNIRDLRYREWFEDEDYRHRVVANLIYDLAPGRPRSSPVGEDAFHVPEAAVALARAAKAMPTTFWFENDRQLDDLILCGRLTACYNLFGWTRRLRAAGLAQREATELEQRVEGMWRGLCTTCDRE